MKNITIDFTKIGGYRFKQATLSKMQESYLTYLKSLVAFLGCEEIGSYIVYGCKISGENITSGVMYIDGELCPFEQTNGDLNTLIAKEATITTLSFKNGIDQPVFRELKAVKVSSGGTKLSDFTRFNYVQDPNYVHTDNNFTTTLLSKLLGIEAGAEKNVQADWNATNPASPAFVKNKPSGLTRILKEGIVMVGDITDVNVSATINFGNIGLTDTDYQPNITIESISSEIGQVKSAAKMGHVVYDKTLTSFKVCFQESSGAGAQNIQIRYSIIKPTV